MIKELSFVSGGMVVNADRLERAVYGPGMYNLIKDGIKVASIDLDLARLKVLHLYKGNNYINVTYSIDYKTWRD